MYCIPRVCAEFHDPAGAVLFTFEPHQLMTVVEAPESIRQDPLFDMLVRDGSLTVPGTKAELKKLENDPLSLPEKAGKAEELLTAVADSMPAADPAPAAEPAQGAKAAPGRKAAEKK